MTDRPAEREQGLPPAGRRRGGPGHTVGDPVRDLLAVAVEYAHRHLAEVGLAWQFPAEDPAVLLAEFARLAAQLGAGGWWMPGIRLRGCMRCRGQLGHRQAYRSQALPSGWCRRRQQAATPSLTRCHQPKVHVARRLAVERVADPVQASDSARCSPNDAVKRTTR